MRFLRKERINCRCTRMAFPYYFADTRLEHRKRTRKTRLPVTNRTVFMADVKNIKRYYGIILPDSLPQGRAVTDVVFEVVH